jgi:DNA-directed RNA polymerase subunit RPC12/RpoP
MGRKKGSKNQPAAPVVEHAGTLCPKCGSTKREPYKGSYSKKLKGVWLELEYDTIYYRQTKCSECGQRRVDKEYVLVGDDVPEKVVNEKPPKTSNCRPDPDPPPKPGPIA